LMSWRHSEARGLGHESSVFPGQNGLFVLRTIVCTCRLSPVSSAGTEAQPSANTTNPTAHFITHHLSTLESGVKVANCRGRWH